MRAQGAPSAGAPLTLLWLASLLLPSAVWGQELEPRAYITLPVGLNFLIEGYAYSEGGLSTDPSLPVEDAHLKTHTGVLAYARSLDLWGRSGKFDVIVLYSQLSGTASFAEQPRQRDVSGFGDPRFRLSVNFYGAPSPSRCRSSLPTSKTWSSVPACR